MPSSHFCTSATEKNALHVGICIKCVSIKARFVIDEQNMIVYLTLPLSIPLLSGARSHVRSNSDKTCFVCFYSEDISGFNCLYQTQQQNKRTDNIKIWTGWHFKVQPLWTQTANNTKDKKSLLHVKENPDQWISSWQRSTASLPRPATKPKPSSPCSNPTPPPKHSLLDVYAHTGAHAHSVPFISLYKGHHFLWLGTLRYW